MATIQLPPWFHSSLHLFGFPRVRSSWKFNQINKLFIIRQFETDRFSFVSFALSRQIIIFVIRSRWRSAVERELMRLAERKGGGKFDLPYGGIWVGNFRGPPSGSISWTNVNKMEAGSSIYRKSRRETGNRSDNYAATSLPEQACGSQTLS